MQTPIVQTFQSRSPVPFGGVLFADCGMVVSKTVIVEGSPVPFGGVLFADSHGYKCIRVCEILRSPVPFGGVLFADFGR